MPKSSPVTLTSIKTLLKQELKAQRNDIVDALLKYIDETVATKEEVKELKAQISHLPNKEEYYKKMDEYIKETKASREENALLPHQVSDLRTRVSKIEHHIGIAAS